MLLLSIDVLIATKKEGKEKEKDIKINKYYINEQCERYQCFQFSAACRSLCDIVYRLRDNRKNANVRTESDLVSGDPTKLFPICFLDKTRPTPVIERNSFVYGYRKRRDDSNDRTREIVDRNIVADPRNE